MGIKFNCPNCDSLLNIKSNLAGLRGICPHCDSKILIPQATDVDRNEANGSAATDPMGDAIQVPATQVPVRKAQQKPAVIASPKSPAPSAQGVAATKIEPAKAAPVDAFPSSNSAAPVQAIPAKAVATSLPPVTSQETGDPLVEAPDAVWYVRPPGGGQFGPASADLMRQWITEGRIGAHSLVWRDGWADWMVAQNVFPQFGAVSAPQTSVAQSSALPSAINPQAGLVNTNTTNQKKLEYYRTRKRKATCGIAVIFVGIMVIAALGILLAIVLTNS